MDKFDRYMEMYCFCRFSDDINVYCKSLEEATQIMVQIQQWLEQNLHLAIHKEKSGIYPAISRRFLGYEFYKNKNDEKIYIRRYHNDNQTYYRKWNQSAIQKIDRNYHLINDGILTKKDYTLLFENEDGKHYIPVETCDSINIYSQVIFSSSFLSLQEKKV